MNRLLRRAQRLMVVGLLASFLGSQLVEGAVNGLIVLGVFPLAWIPIYRTVTDVQDAFAAAVSRFVERHNPGHVLVVCEATDVVLTSVAIAMILLGPSGWVAPVLVVYLLVASFLPLVVDLAEEFYLNDVAQIDGGAVVRANMLIAVGTGVGGLLIGRPVGALTSVSGIATVLALNVALSLVAIVLRIRSGRLYAPEHASPSPEADADGFVVGIRRFFFPSGPGAIVRNGFLSPVFSFVFMLSTSVLGTYVVLWVAGEADGNGVVTRLSVLLFAMGASAIVSPYVIGRILERNGETADRLLRWLLGLFSFGCTAAVVVRLTWDDAVGSLVIFLCLLVITASSQGVLFAVSTLRQLRLSSTEFREVVGWSFSMSAIGGICGAWLGYALRAAQDPLAALLVAAGIGTALFVWAMMSRSSTR
ncbi:MULTISPECIES: MFS transporter [Brevibacterium]|nr:MFS transporter [Brevibacterium casei]MBE4695436.1 MFS transporter [Brevibacterium casei]MBY3578558.1 MFS transporter [Brevibacterium casei]MDH5149855.1 MFS transporter [Brevibacterium casei]